ncbi:hypothetical protein [Pseudomonas peli]|uniref:hypothetical protein n=1 Tax=Pseudomonas peli TaxID=592361 RepID=UPI0024AD0103|nr:hypothetical protein [Pseudomonas peli]
MARSTMEVAFISAEKVQFDNVKLVKLFVGDAPDGERDLGVSLLSMNVAEESLDEVWEVCKNLDVLEPIRVTAEIDRGSKNVGKFIVLHVESAKPTARAAAPQPNAQQQAKPAAQAADPAKS